MTTAGTILLAAMSVFLPSSTSSHVVFVRAVSFMVSGITILRNSIPASADSTTATSTSSVNRITTTALPVSPHIFINSSTYNSIRSIIISFIG